MEQHHTTKGVVVRQVQEEDEQVEQVEEIDCTDLLTKMTYYVEKYMLMKKKLNL